MTTILTTLRGLFFASTLFGLLGGLLAGCGGNIALKPALPATAVISKRIPLKVHLRFEGNRLAPPILPQSSAAIGAGKVHWDSVSSETGRASVALFRQAMHALFEEVTDDPQAADLVIVPEIKEQQTTGGRSPSASITYEAEVFSSDRALSLRIRGSGQKARNTSFFDSPANIQEQQFRVLEDAMQEAVVAVMDQMSRELAAYANARQGQKPVKEPAAPSAKSAAPESFVASDVDRLPPITQRPNKRAYAIVIGIEQYREKLPKADFAARDAKLVGDYLTKVLGYPEENVVVRLNERAAKTDFEKYFEEWLRNNVEEGDSVFVYYSGHGAPNHTNGEAYLVPYDGDPAFTQSTAYPLKRLYAALDKLPAKEVVVVLDSCFSGSGGRSVLAKGARPLAITIDSPAIVSGKTMVLAAGAADQISNTYEEKGHGLLTYFFLKGLQGEGDADGDGIITMSELFKYVKPSVQRVARKQYNNEQTPQLSASPALLEKGGVRMIERR